MKVLVSGAAGFVGSRALELLADEHELVGLGRGEAPARLPEGAEWVRRDLAEGLEPAGLPSSVDAVVHLAQSRRYADFPAGARDVFSVNVGSTFDLLEYAREAGARSFVLASSGGVYRRQGRPMAEGDAVEASDIYFASKLASEQLLGAYSEVLRPVVLRPFFVYGPSQPTMMVAGLVKRVLAGEPISVRGELGLSLNPTYVDDMVAAIAASVGGDASGVFNVAGGDVVTFTDLVSTIGDVAGRVAHLTNEPGDPDPDLVADTTRMREDLGVIPATTLREGLERTVEATP